MFFLVSRCVWFQSSSFPSPSIFFYDNEQARFQRLSQTTEDMTVESWCHNWEPNTTRVTLPLASTWRMAPWVTWRNSASLRPSKYDLPLFVPLSLRPLLFFLLPSLLLPRLKFLAGMVLTYSLRLFFGSFLGWVRPSPLPIYSPFTRLNNKYWYRQLRQQKWFSEWTILSEPPQENVKLIQEWVVTNKPSTCNFESMGRWECKKPLRRESLKSN